MNHELHSLDEWRLQDLLSHLPELALGIFEAARVHAVSTLDDIFRGELAAQLKGRRFIK